MQDGVSSTGIMGRDTLLVDEEPTPVKDGGSESLKESRRIQCRVLLDTKDSEELRSLC